MELKIRMPPDLLPYDEVMEYGQKTPLTESECKIYLIITLSVALTFCVLSATIVMVACFKRYQETKAHDRRKRREAEEREEMARTEVKSVPTQDKTTLQPTFDIQNPRGFVYAQPSQTQQRPVTVRSVKRRDKAKIEEKNIRNGSLSGFSGNFRPPTNDDRAVMV